MENSTKKEVINGDNKKRLECRVGVNDFTPE